MGTVPAIDVASYQPTDLSGLIQQTGAQHVIIHLYHDQESVSWTHSVEQIISAAANGCSVGGYAFLYPGTDMVRTINSVVDRCATINLVLPILWLDVEEFQGQDLSPQELAQAVEHCAALGVPAGIYSSSYMWSRIGNPSGFSHLPLWAAQYTPATPTLDDFRPFGEWGFCVAKQWATVPCDQNVILVEYTEIPQPDPCEELKGRLREIIDARPYKSPSRKKLKALLESFQ